MKILLSKPNSYNLIKNQNILLFHIILKKIKSNLAYRKLSDIAKLATMGVSATFTINPKLFAPTLNKDKDIGKISNKVKLLVSKFASLPQEKIIQIFAYKF